MKLTILILVFNEAKTILQAIEDAKKIPVADREIIIVDNYSTDSTRELLKKVKDPSIRIIFQENNFGAGKSVRVGLEEARGQFTYVHHSDLEYDYRAAIQMLEAAEKNTYDVVLGSRLANTKSTAFDLIRQRPEYFATILTTSLINRWYKKNFTDVIGSRLYRTASVKKVPTSTDGVGAEFEHIGRMCKAGLKIGEIPVAYKPRANRSEKKIKFYNMINALFFLYKVRFFENISGAANDTKPAKERSVS